MTRCSLQSGHIEENVGAKYVLRVLNNVGFEYFMSS